MVSPFVRCFVAWVLRRLPVDRWLFLALPKIRVIVPANSRRSITLVGLGEKKKTDAAHGVVTLIESRRGSDGSTAHRGYHTIPTKHYASCSSSQHHHITHNTIASHHNTGLPKVTCLSSKTPRSLPHRSFRSTLTTTSSPALRDNSTFTDSEKCNPNPFATVITTPEPQNM